MLYTAKLQKRFWAEAVITAAYILNRSPHFNLEKTSEEIWSGLRPNVKHLKVFGCVAYSHIPKQQRKKFDKQSEKSIFVGYSETTKGFRLYNHKRHLFH